ncbi:type IV pili methyl-accepting chemotaxis transducer N-terminal domain-containing protein [Tamlana sp. 2_MG-2023]|uniref:sensor histidine kinase n=1 Tax=unclassified Tamlana TaxID=2614803 RepID=UPI0026E47F84|nr:MULTISPECIES: ATP-binding protein [unclassified Tamlana]MDO6758978.1 type IV pili methyl-accepting chemotaxis transducer N-terminal domain-containing protein [Tamlana sp. 2_MG-2023]MDO6789677.1 type IV pili methyl-accepting chemotaxis transducer N-terminal domain-containing protein [Tamlana sp. 1_MG-2023]
MTKHGNSLDQRTFDKLSRLYIIALSAIAVSVILSQILIRNHLSDQETDSSVINVAGRQRMLSQKLTKDVVSLSTGNSLETRVLLKNKIKETLDLWKLSHYALQNGSDSLGLPAENTEEIRARFSILNPVFDKIGFASNSIISIIEENPEAPISNFAKEIDVVKEKESDFLLLMDDIVNQYDLEAAKKVDWLRRLEMWLTGLTLIILLGEFLFIFWPAAKSVKSALSELLFAEKRAKKMAFDADELSLAKEKSIKELRALSRAMDDTLLFARILPNGHIVHMGNKFSRLFKYSKMTDIGLFWTVLSQEETEQVMIEDLITKYKKTGWQGEVKASTKEGDDVWLEMAIIPYSPTEDRSELLIIASEITDRKEAQLEIDRLTTASFEEKMNQQKIISSKIIENQEKEQNRIAKDVHDGIGQMLTGLKYNLESIDTSNIEKATAKIENLKVLASDIIKGIRTATFNLAPPELTDHGIVPAIAKLTQELAKLTGKQIMLFNKTDFNQRLDSLVEINIYRITQEAINNAIKYAETSHILVALSHSKDILSIVIDDNGKGFDPKNIKNVKNGDGGMGMTFMRERIKYIDGRFFLNSEIGKGTRVTLNIPLK